MSLARPSARRRRGVEEAEEGWYGLEVLEYVEARLECVPLAENCWCIARALAVEGASPRSVKLSVKKDDLMNQ